MSNLAKQKQDKGEVKYRRTIAPLPASLSWTSILAPSMTQFDFIILVDVHAPSQPQAVQFQQLYATFQLALLQYEIMGPWCQPGIQNASSGSTEARKEVAILGWQCFKESATEGVRCRQCVRQGWGVNSKHSAGTCSWRPAANMCLCTV